jgi:GAF domain-containing protein
MVRFSRRLFKIRDPLDCSVCVRVATARIPIVIQDAKRDKKWRDHPAVTDDFRFYAGFPLFTRERVPIRAMCIVNQKPKRFTAANLQSLNSFAVIANCMLEKVRLYAKIEKCCP